MLANLKSNLEIKCNVCSLDHSYFLENKPKIKRPLPSNIYYGHRGMALKSIDTRSEQHKGYILIGDGFPAKPTIFENRCLPVAFTIGKKSDIQMK